MGFTICIAGLGLMGASLAGALKGFKSADIIGVDADAAVREKALAGGFVAAAYGDITQAAPQADLLVFCVYARHIPALLAGCLPVLKPGCVLTDICGVKGPLYSAILPTLPQGLPYVGIHPMAGKERDGIGNADAGLYRGSSLLICPTAASTPPAVALMQALALHIGCARTTVVDCQKHDAIIAYTSDLMHLSAAGLCLHYHPEMDLSFTAGAFRDCTRVADINAAAWTELLLENRPNTLAALDVYIADLQRLRGAMAEKDEAALARLLEEAGQNKREMLRR